MPDERLPNLSSDDVVRWVQRAAVAVSTYYERFPATKLNIRIHYFSGVGVRHGVTYPYGGGLINISVGRNTSPDDLESDWTMTHEMIHLAFPSMSDDYHWIEEGISTYVEPVARAQAGQMPVAEVWQQFVDEMPKGATAVENAGLDEKQTWASTYWGGALFCLVADVRIREQTHNKKGLADALRAILAGGGVITQDWPIEKAFQVGDAATGTRVLQDLHKEMGSRSDRVDLNLLWQKLGVSVANGHIRFDDKAPEAEIRKAITQVGRRS